MAWFLVSLLLIANSTAQQPGAPAGVLEAAKEYVDDLRLTCPADPSSCTQKFQLKNLDDLARARAGEPWAAFVLTFDDFRNTPFQNLLKTARFNYYACPIVIDDQFKGIVRVCEDPEAADKWVSCGSRGPTRMAEANTYHLTLAPKSDSLQVAFVLTVENNSRYIVVQQGGEYFAIAGSDVAAEMIGVHLGNVSRMTMYPLAEVLFKVNRTIKQRDDFKR
jgi:hypothetical protein